jgi:hypothetical protein
MRMAKEDLLHLRSVAASNGCELTPQEAINLLKIVKPDLEIVDEPGLVTRIKNGDSSTSRPTIDS